MAQSPWGDSPWSGSKFKAPQFAKPSRAQRKKKKDDGGILGHVFKNPATKFLGNLADDVKDAALGLPRGLWDIGSGAGEDLFDTVFHQDADFENTREVGGKVLSGMWETYSPLFHGDIEGFAKGVYAHPLAPILDVATVFTLGAGGVVRGGAVVAKAGEASSLGRAGARLAKAGERQTELIRVKGATDVARHYRGNPVLRARQKAAVYTGHELAEHLPKWFGQRTVVDAMGKSEVQTGRIRNLTDEGFHARKMKKMESARGKAASVALITQISAFGKAAKDIEMHPQRIAGAIEASAVKNFDYHAMRVPESNLIRNPRTQMLEPKEGISFVRAHPKEVDYSRIKTGDDFERHMRPERFSSRHMTKDSRLAKRDANGDYLTAMDHSAKAWFDEAHASTKMLRLLYKNPTTVWKYLILATRPAYFVNNVVGNSLMYMVEFGGMGALRGVADTIKQMRGKAALERSLTGAERELRSLIKPDLMDEAYLGQVQGLSRDIMEITNLKSKRHARAAKVANVAGRGLFPVTHKWSDVFLRQSGINVLLRRHPEVRRLMKEEGMSFDQAAAKVSRDPHVRDRIHERLDDALGNYTHLNSVERGIRQLVPFYTWDRAIMRHTTKLALNKPAKAGALTRIGTEGVEATEEDLGAIPEFLKSYIPIGKGKGGRQRLLGTVGINPYATAPSVIDAAVAIVGGDPAKAGRALGGQLGPIPTGAIEYMTGKDLFSGAEVQPGAGGLVGNLGKSLVVDTPPGEIIRRLLAGGEIHPKKDAKGKTTPFLFRKDVGSAVLPWLGASLKEADMSRVAEARRRELGTRKGRRKQASSAPYLSTSQNNTF